MTYKPPAISKIKKNVKSSLASTFKEMSTGEFEGYAIFPENAEELVSIFLSVTANHGTKDILKEFGLGNMDDLASKFAEAKQMINKNDKLVFKVKGLAQKLNIPDDSIDLFFSPPDGSV